MTQTTKLSNREKCLASRYLIVDTASPSGLRWTGHWAKNTASRVRGRHFGSETDGYWQGQLSGRAIRAHNLIWWLTYGEDPADQWPQTVDHRDRNGLNNSLENLRLLDKSGQARNRSQGVHPAGYLKPSEILGASGKRWVIPSGNRWRGRFCYKRKHIDCGTFATVDEAYQAVLEKRATLGLPIPKEENLGE